jgi:uncharacterized protein
LLRDPQQLDQPTQGTHPDGTGVSALDRGSKGIDFNKIIGTHAKGA